MSRLILGTLLALAGCTGERAKEATSAVIGKAVEVSKGTASGIVEGMKEGRAEAPSVDGARVISRWDQLEGAGSITVLKKLAAGDHTAVELALENTGDVPLRFSGLSFLALDDEGFTLEVSAPSTEQTVPPKARSRLTVQVTAAPAKVAKLRVWTHELTVP